jgi:hypothetical protein
MFPSLTTPPMSIYNIRHNHFISFDIQMSSDEKLDIFSD